MLGARSIPDSQWFAMDPRTMRSGAFSVVVRGSAGNVPVFGTLASRYGLAFISPSPISAGELVLDVTIRSHSFPTRVRVVAQDEVQHKNKSVLRYFTQLVGIAADDWDFLVRYVEDKPEPAAVAPVPTGPDEDFRLLPLRVQRQIVALLSGARRLAAPTAGAAPLIRYNTIRSHTAGVLVYKDIMVHSRIAIDGEVRNHATRFRLHPGDHIEELKDR